MAHITMCAATYYGQCHVRVWDLRALTLGLKTNEVPEIIMGGLPLGYLVVRFRLHCMHEIRELDGILNEENGDVVPDNVPNTLLRIELGGKATNVADGILSHRCQQSEKYVRP